MPSWLQQSFQENTLAWLLISSIIGGVIGAFLRLLFDVLLPQSLQQRREVLVIKRKYTTPILLAAVELRGRLENMITFIQRIEQEHWLSSEHPSGYYYVSTLYVVGQFFGWLQILRRTIAYLDFASVKETRQFENFLRAIERGFSSPGLLIPNNTGYPAQSPDKWIVTFRLQAVGDLMITREDDQYRTLDYAAFCKRLGQAGDAEFKQWYAPVEDLFRDLTSGELRFKRLVAIHAYLNAFVNFSDPKHLRAKRQSDHWELLSPEEAGRIKAHIEQISTDKQAE